MAEAVSPPSQVTDHKGGKKSSEHQNRKKLVKVKAEQNKQETDEDENKTELNQDKGCDTIKKAEELNLQQTKVDVNNIFGKDATFNETVK